MALWRGQNEHFIRRGFVTIREEERDLFSVPSDYYLVHCVSADFALGAGIAKQFDQKFDMRRKLKEAWSAPSSDYNVLVGKTLRVDRVFNLVTKERYFQKPTYRSVESALRHLREQYVDKFGITKLAMPRIACGLDGKNWTKVRGTIETVFNGANVEVLVCVQ